MVTISLVIGLVSIAALVACAAAQPAGERGRQHSAARRRRFVQQHPTYVNSLDIRRELVRGGIAPDQAQFITDKAADQGIKPFTMWLWLAQVDAEALAVVVAADLSHLELLAHISDGTVPDLEELKLFASVNGLVLDDATDAAPRRKALVEAAVMPQRKPLPAVLGSSPLVPAAARLPRQGGLAA